MLFYMTALIMGQIEMSEIFIILNLSKQKWAIILLLLIITEGISLKH